MLLLKYQLFRNVNAAKEVHLLSNAFLTTAYWYFSTFVYMQECNSAWFKATVPVFLSVIPYHFTRKCISHAIDSKIPVISRNSNKTGIMSVSLFWPNITVFCVLLHATENQLGTTETWKKNALFPHDLDTSWVGSFRIKCISLFLNIPVYCWNPLWIILDQLTAYRKVSAGSSLKDEISLLSFSFTNCLKKINNSFKQCISR